MSALTQLKHTIHTLSRVKRLDALAEHGVMIDCAYNDQTDRGLAECKRLLDEIRASGCTVRLCVFHRASGKRIAKVSISSPLHGQVWIEGFSELSAAIKARLFMVRLDERVEVAA